MFVLCLAQRGSLGVIFIAVLNNSVYRFLEVGGKGLAVGPVGTLKCDFVDYLYLRSCNTGDVVCLCSLVWLHPPPVLPLCGVLVDVFSDGCLHWKHSHLVWMNPTQEL